MPCALFDLIDGFQVREDALASAAESSCAVTESVSVQLLRALGRDYVSNVIGALVRSPELSTSTDPLYPNRPKSPSQETTHNAQRH